MRPIPALVTDVVGVVRSLGDVGIPSIVASEYPRSPTFRSRHCIRDVRLPNLGEEPERAVEILLKIGMAFPGRPPILTGRESDVAMVSRGRERLAPLFRIQMAPIPLMEAVNDKTGFMDLSVRFDLPVPRSWSPEVIREVTFPCLLKPPAQGYWAREKIYSIVGRWRKGLLIGNRDDLNRAVERLAAADAPDFIVQEFIPGGDDQLFDFHAYFPAPGKVAGFFLGRKIRTSPRTFGQGSYTRSWIAPEISKVAIEILERLNYIGPANLNLKRDPRTGRIHLLEINPRFSIWCHLASRSGVNLPLAMYNDCLGLPLPKLEQSPLERRWLYFYFDWRTLPEYRRAGEWNRWTWFRSLLFPRVTFFRWDWADPLPLLGSLWQFLAVRVELRLRRILGYFFKSRGESSVR
ncbi:MAG: ATP-grasp domain-containing protein [Pseudomonadota bacterium]